MQKRSNMFRCTQEPSSWSYNQCLAKITLTMSVPTLTVEQGL